LKNTLSLWGPWVAIASLLSGCIDPGPDPASVSTRSASDGSRTATVSWDAPTSNNNGTPLTDLAGYRIYYGSSPENLSHTVKISTVGLQTYVIDDLEAGTWYFAVRAVASNGTESTLSDIAAKTIQGEVAPPEDPGLPGVPPAHIT
jgi:Fibronectin type III domain